jgi:(S)-2-hydroxyglutarate dehydrogenase
VVDFGRVAGAYAEDVRADGGEVITDSEVTGIDAGGGSIRLSLRPGAAAGDEPASGVVEAGFAVFCAGAWSDRLAVMAGAPAEPRIVPFRGGYLKLRPERRDLVRANIYPVPDAALPFLGGHLTRTIDGEVLLGPSALMVAARDAYRLGRVRPSDLGSTLSWPGTWRLVARFWRTGLTEISHAASRRSFVRALQRYVPELRAADAIPGPSGIRAQALDRDGRLVDDFVVHETERALHVRNATSSLAIARLIADRVDAAR